MKSSSRVGSIRTRWGECRRSVAEVAPPVPDRPLHGGAHLVGEERPGRAPDGVDQQEGRDPAGLGVDEGGGHPAAERVAGHQGHLPLAHGIEEVATHRA